MAHIVVLGAGTGGMPAAYELREELGSEHEITMVNEREYFQFVPSNPWVAVGWRDRDNITFDIRPHLERKGINFVAKRCDKIDAGGNTLTFDDGETLQYDYLVIATGPRLAFEEVEGAGPQGGHTTSVCTVDHAEGAYEQYKQLLDDPGHVVVGVAGVDDERQAGGARGLDVDAETFLLHCLRLGGVVVVEPGFPDAHELRMRGEGDEVLDPVGIDVEHHVLGPSGRQRSRDAEGHEVDAVSVGAG